MNRGYTREWYLNKIEKIKYYMPNCGLSTDIIAGFCSETEAEHQETISLMEAVRYDSAFMFFYSERPGTPAAKKLVDDVPESVKKQRLSQIIDLQNQHSRESNFKDIGSTLTVLIEGDSKRSAEDYCGRSDQNKMVVFPKKEGNFQPGNYAQVKITGASSATLLGEWL